MKVKLSNEEISKILSDPVKAKDAGDKVSDHWWVIAPTFNHLKGLTLNYESQVK